MADKPIIFSAPMVRSLIEGRKTMTRRVLIKLRRFGQITEFGHSDTHGYDWHFRDKEMRWHDLRHADLMTYLPHHVGSKLWVREAWRTFVGMNNTNPRDIWNHGCGYGAGIMYEADKHGLAITKDGERWKGPRDNPKAFGKLRSPMLMPRWASRITLIVTDVRVQRLQEIDREDAIAEGLIHKPGVIEPNWWLLPEPFHQGTWLSPIAAFRYLWDSINDARGYGWDVNPWIAAYSFKTVFSNIDSMEE